MTDTATLSTNPELDAYKERVVVVAKIAAKKHGWCTVVDDLLDQIEATTELPIDEMLSEAADSAYEDGRESGEQSGREDGYEHAREIFKPALDLVDEVLLFHDDQHRGVARFCVFAMCRSAWGGQDELANL